MRRTRIITIHTEREENKPNEEQGVILNEDLDDNREDECFFYTYKDGTYIIFNTIDDMFKYYIGDKDIKRAYMEEKDFDNFYDADEIQGSFSEHLEWV